MRHYTSGRLSPKNQSLILRLGGAIRTMKRHSVIFGCLVTLTGVILAMPNDMRMPLMVKREMEKVTTGTKRINDDAADTPTIDYTAYSANANTEEDMTTIEMIRKTGYPAEEHFVTSEDGYILALHRIPGDEGSPAVLLHHALLESSFCWIVNGKERGLAYILADKGYDVWMGNARGNTYSKRHNNFSSSDPEFWNFSWHEMGIYDVPAEIEYITSIKNDSIMYVGHSMGTTMFYVMASKRPDVASKVKAMFGLAPVAFTDNMRGPFWLIGSILERAQKSISFHGKSEFFAQGAIFKFLANCICNKLVLKNICRAAIFATVGFNIDQFNLSLLPLILSHTPAGTSLKTILHFAQGMKSKKFLQYDYGVKDNLKIYNSETPPAYDLTKIQVPITFFWAENDYLAQPKDVKRLYEKLPKKFAIYKIEDPHFNHLDFIWANNAAEVVYSKLTLIMDKYRSSNETTTS